MIVKQIRLSSQSKDRLGRLKGKTGIKNRNVLCRWELCYSLGEYSMPTDIPIVVDSNVEMSWFTFAGEYNDLYADNAVITFLSCTAHVARHGMIT